MFEPVFGALVFIHHAFVTASPSFHIFAEIRQTERHVFETGILIHKRESLMYHMIT